jgi:hypothetical protein
MIFTVVRRDEKTGKKGAFLGTVEAESARSAYHKARRIAASSKPCAWRGVSWSLREAPPLRRKRGDPRLKQSRRAMRRELAAVSAAEGCAPAQSYLTRASRVDRAFRQWNGVLIYD